MQGTPSPNIFSVFGRFGAITAQSGDYTFDQIGSTPTTLSGYGITDAQALDADLTAIAGLSTTGTIERTGAGTASTYTVTAAAKTVLDDATVGDMLTTLGAQALDADLDAIAALTTTGLIDRTGAGTATTRATGATGLSVLAAANAATARTTIGAAGFTQGTWTPAYIMSTSGSITPSTRQGRWALWDDLCWFSLTLLTSSLSSPVGSVRVSIPFPNAETTQIPLTIIGAAWATTFPVLGAILTESAQYIRLIKNESSASTADVVAADLASTGNAVRISGIYRVTL